MRKITIFQTNGVAPVSVLGIDSANWNLLPGNVLFFCTWVGVFFISQFTSSCRPTAHTLTLSRTISESIDMQVSSRAKVIMKNSFKSNQMTWWGWGRHLGLCKVVTILCQFYSLKRDHQIFAVADNSSIWLLSAENVWSSNRQHSCFKFE